MAKFLRLLVVALTAASLLAGTAVAGPVNLDGDPDTPHITEPGKPPAKTEAPDIGGISVPGHSVTSDQVEETTVGWWKFVRAWFSLHRVFFL